MIILPRTYATVPKITQIQAVCLEIEAFYKKYLVGF